VPTIVDWKVQQVSGRFIMVCCRNSRHNHLSTRKMEIPTEASDAPVRNESRSDDGVVEREEEGSQRLK